MLGGVAFGHVAGDLGKADETPSLVAHRIQDGQRPKAAAVLANPPALALEAAMLPGSVERPLHQAKALVLDGEEHPEGPADHL
jgi:hypothetical protein